MAQLKHFFCKWLKVCVLAFFPGLFWVENPKGRILKRKTCCAFLPFKCKACQDFKCIANMRRLKNHIPHNLSHQTILLKPCHKINHLFTSLLTSPNKKKHVACLGLGLSVCVFFSFQWKLKTLALVAPVHSRNPYHKSGETLRRPTKRGGVIVRSYDKNMSMKHARHKSRKGCKWCVHFSLKIMSLSLDVHVHSQKNAFKKYTTWNKQRILHRKYIAIPKFYHEQLAYPTISPGFM